MKVIWKGRYSYEPEFDILNSHPFELILEFESDHFEGVAIEDEFTTLTNESPNVNGFIDADLISFTKQYPFQFELDENGQLVIDRSLPGHEVVYEGRFKPEIGQWEGTWEIITDEVKLSAEEYKTEMVYGSWRMKTE